jgi:DNA-binding transcriptional LysR family regulator
MTDISYSNILQQLPPLSTLPAFETAARLGSFSKAAQELNSSQPAISQQIRQLEIAVGQKLFRRKSQGVALTEAGEDLRVAVQQGFTSLREVMARLREPRLRLSLTVATDFAFAAYWLLPRLDRFKAEIPLVDVRILTAQHTDDLGSANADIAILFGHPPATKIAPRRDGKITAKAAGMIEGSRLFSEAVFPVCAPGYAHHAAKGAAGWLATATLLHLDDVAAGPQQPQRTGTRWFGWSDWVDACGLALPVDGPQLRFNNYSLVLQAAIAGQGVALGWSPLVEPLLAAGQLVRADDFVLRSRRGYIVTRLGPSELAGYQRPGRPAAEIVSAADRFLDWLQREARLAGKSNVIQSSASTSSAPKRR